MQMSLALTVDDRGACDRPTSSRRCCAAAWAADAENRRRVSTRAAATGQLPTLLCRLCGRVVAVRIGLVSHK